MRIDKDILCYDFQGWPVWKMTLREIIEESGLFIHDEETGTYSIKDTDPKLDLYPRTLEDDGMGYGVNKKYVTEISYIPVENDDDVINIFIEADQKEKDSSN